MWGLCFGLYGVAKLLTLAELGTERRLPLDGRLTAYLLLWIGMDAKAFLGRGRRVAAPPWIEWAHAIGNTVLGLVLIWGVARQCVTASPLLAGWVGMAGGILFLHFGTFHLLSLAWRKAGVEAAPQMRSPHRAVSPSAFWGQRWNRAFHLLVVRHVFRPLGRRIGALPALWVGFLVSGLIHDLVISVPARAGYGLPTLYFLLQALGVTVERMPVAQKLGLGRGGRGWAFAMLCVVAPAGLLFHEAFVGRVMLPFLHFLRAL
jgi:hypothetical protein